MPKKGIIYKQTFISFTISQQYWIPSSRVPFSNEGAVVDLPAPFGPAITMMFGLLVVTIFYSFPSTIVISFVSCLPFSSIRLRSNKGG